MNARIPFKAQLHGITIVLTGDLDGSPVVRRRCEKVAKIAFQSSENYLVVDAQQARLPVGGSEAWAAVAEEILKWRQLVYLPSQLAQNLEYDENYSHTHSKFFDTDDEAADFLSSISGEEAVPSYVTLVAAS